MVFCSQKLPPFVSLGHAFLSLPAPQILNIFQKPKKIFWFFGDPLARKYIQREKLMAHTNLIIDNR